MYEVDKRDLQDEVRGEEMFGRLVRSWTVSAFLSQIIACTGVLCCFALFVCLTLLAFFFLLISFKNMYLQSIFFPFLLSLPPLSPQLSHERQNAQLKEEEKDQIRKTMHGFVSQEKEKFERLAKHMKYQQKDLQAKSAQIEQVKELIRNSPRVGSSGGRAPLRDTQVSAEGHICQC